MLVGTTTEIGYLDDGGSIIISFHVILFGLTSYHYTDYYY